MHLHIWLLIYQQHPFGRNSVSLVKITFGYELNNQHPFNTNLNINDNIYKILTDKSKEQWATILCLGYDLLFTVSSRRFELGFGSVSLFTESNQNFFQKLLREGVWSNTNLLIRLVSCHYAIAKHVRAEITQAGLQESNGICEAKARGPRDVYNSID